MSKHVVKILWGASHSSYRHISLEEGEDGGLMLRDVQPNGDVATWKLKNNWWIQTYHSGHYVDPNNDDGNSAVKEYNKLLNRAYEELITQLGIEEIILK